MTVRYYRVEQGGDDITNVTEAATSSIGTGTTEVAIDFDALGMNKMLALKALEAIRLYILRDAYPPTTS